MPTSKPRITITLTEYQHAILRRISESSGRSMSGVISEFMLAAQPTLERMAHTFQQLKQDRDEDHQRVAGLLAGLNADRDRKILCDQSDVRAERGEKNWGNETTQGERDYSGGPADDQSTPEHLKQ
ncbi:MAG TPA: hypothetical protein VFI43_00855 [Nitrosospira sp.]|nr:hypothetical protein [Nitrosospira sp.]